MKDQFPTYKTVKTSSLIPYARNSRTHSEQQVSKIAASIKEFGFLNPVIVDGANGIVAGHGRVLAAQKLGMDALPVIEANHLTDAQRRAYVIADNRLALDAGWDDEMLRVEFAELVDMDFDLELTGFTADEISALTGDEEESKESAESKSTLSDRFLVPPFSVLNAREGEWQSRKKGWLSIGIKSELGREAAVSGSKMVAGYGKDGRETGLMNESDTSVFDPALCELLYGWFSGAGGLVLDPFAGGSVRGIVASKMERQYIGVELRPEQVEANRIQAGEICSDPIPVWHIGDSANIARIANGVEADFLFSCPPYADLEVYSDNPKDLSTMKYKDFRSAYFQIIKESCLLLKNDRFACFVVGEVRDKKGNYVSFVPDTIRAFEEAGLSFYNEIILVTAIGSLPIRAGRTFVAGRKVGKTHQNILVFVKGDGKKAAQSCGDCSFKEVEPDAGEVERHE